MSVHATRIAVLGTGANGAGVAADFIRAGHDVTLIEQWPANVEQMRNHGLRVEMPDETTVTPVRALHLSDVATLRKCFDVVFLVVKAYDTKWACELIKPYLSEGGVVVGLQNGMTVDAIAEVVGPARTLGSVIEVAAAMYSPGVVERHTPPSGSWFALGGLVPEAQVKAGALADILGSAGTVEIVDDIRSSKWMKLVVNAAELVPSAIVDLPLLDAANLPGMHDFMLAAGKEAMKTAVALGNKAVPILGLPIAETDDPEGYVEVMLDTVYTKWSLPHTKTTVLQDWIKGRHSEVEELNGLVVREQQRLGGTCPANQVIVELARRIESGELTRSPDNARLLVGPPL